MEKGKRLYVYDCPNCSWGVIGYRPKTCASCHKPMSKKIKRRFIGWKMKKEKI